MFMLPQRTFHAPGRWPVPLALGLGVGLLMGYGLSARPGAAAAGPAITCQATPGPPRRPPSAPGTTPLAPRPARSSPCPAKPLSPRPPTPVASGPLLGRNPGTL